MAKPLGIKCILLKDESGNKIILDADNAVKVINDKDLLVDQIDTLHFLENHGFMLDIQNGRLQVYINDRFGDLDTDLL